MDVNDNARLLDQRIAIIFASKPLLRETGELIRHMSAAVYTASDHAALSCAQTNSNNFCPRPTLFQSGLWHAYA
ncbi:hypothetical protein [Pseudomonas sp. TH10]|uniref:hypothetical protein n=1 Tax=Pseudomonas sp. TH10 TaxID=2796376 RepID=UPI001913936C|nr:hypothetical protein [Pseudomonas sp. TH10]MBK5518162.1 hypothetical protein [Pseudomonas sp. TH10]